MPIPAGYTSGQIIQAVVGTGKILQVVSTKKTDNFTSTTSGAFTDITGFSVSITPSSTTSKILVVATMNCTVYRPTVVARGFRFVRDSTAIGVGDAAGSRIQGSFGNGSATDEISTQLSGMVLDSPVTTSATTYKVQFRQGNSTAFYLNRSTYKPQSAEDWT